MISNLKFSIAFLAVAAMGLYGLPATAQEETGGEEEASATEGEVAPEAEETAPAEAAPADEEAEAPEETGLETVEDEAEAAVEEEAAPPDEAEAEVEAGAELEATPPAETEAAAGAEAEEAAAAGADVTLEAETKKKKPSPFRNSYFIYENTFSAYSLKKDAQLTYNPYYAMSYSIRPKYYLWKGLYLGLRWDLEQELTNADETTKYRQVIWSDVLVDLAWTAAYTIPKIDFILSPKVRIILPASLASQAQTLYLGLQPSFSLVRIFDVWGGIVLSYAFAYTKYFNQYTSALSEQPILQCPDRGGCAFDNLGTRNPSHRFVNDFQIEVRPLKELYISLLVEIRNYLLYDATDYEYEVGGTVATLEDSGSRHRGYMWYIFEVGYDVLPYFTLALGTSTYNPMLNPGSEYYAPFWNRYTNLYFDVIIDIDGMIHGFMGKGKKQKTAVERL